MSCSRIETPDARFPPKEGRGRWANPETDRRKRQVLRERPRPSRTGPAVL